MIEIDDPGNTQPIREFYVFLSRDDKGNEGVCGAQIEDQHFPMVTGYPSRNLEYMKSLAREISAATGKIVVLAKFTERKDVWSTSN